MKPPISSPFGDQNQPQSPNRIADVPVAVGPYTTSFFVSARLSVKSLLLTPAIRMMTLGFPIFWLLPALPVQKTGAAVVHLDARSRFDQLAAPEEYRGDNHDFAMGKRARCLENSHHRSSVERCATHSVLERRCLYSHFAQRHFRAPRSVCFV